MSNNYSDNRKKNPCPENVLDELRAIESYFDRNYYLANNPDVAASGRDPLIHYYEDGWREGRDPSATFSTTYYLNSNPDVAEAGVNPLLHYARTGHLEKRAIHVFENDSENRRAIGPYFDRDYYLTTNPDVAASGRDPLIHYYEDGWREGRDPSATFSTTYYLNSNPDVAESGVNPLLHYARSGHLEKRAINESETDLESLRAIEAYFDRDYYLANNPDVEASGRDPLIHFHKDGWREGRDPSATFSTTYYLNANPDVAEAKVDPLLHYVRSGLSEGRPTSKPILEPEERKILEELFDKDFYLSSNPDLIGIEIEAIEHYHLHGWREGRDPSPHFNTKYYLDTNWDISNIGINPLLHYGLAGKSEGRKPKRVLHEERLTIERAKPANQYSFIRPIAADQEFISTTDILSLLRKGNFEPLIFSFSHDDYAENFGGVQNIIRNEATQTQLSGGSYIHLSPFDFALTLADETKSTPNFLRCRYNGRYLGLLNVADLSGLANELSRANYEFTSIIHHLMGLHPAIIASFALRSPHKIYYWVHDYFTACEKFTLLRNDLTFCSAPPLASGSCRICVYGKAREIHEARIKSFFEEVNPIVVAPSKTALENWIRFTSCRFKYGKVAEPAVFRFSPTETGLNRHKAPIETSAVLRIAFVGARLTHKGWDNFRNLVELTRENSRYEFFHLGDESGKHISKSLVKFVPVRVTQANPDGMINAIRENQIDVVVSCPKWPETFNFATYEAVSAGAFVVTTKQSGNIARFLEEEAPKQSFIANDDGELLSIFLNGRIFELISGAARHIGELKSTNGTIDLLEAKTPA
ncbi:glycosyltransferase family protein [Methylobacterium sp. CM6246]